MGRVWIWSAEVGMVHKGGCGQNRQVWSAEVGVVRRGRYGSPGTTTLAVLKIPFLYSLNVCL